MIRLRRAVKWLHVVFVNTLACRCRCLCWFTGQTCVKLVCVLCEYMYACMQVPVLWFTGQSCVKLVLVSVPRLACGSKLCLLPIQTCVKSGTMCQFHVCTAKCINSKVVHWYHKLVCLSSEFYVTIHMTIYATFKYLFIYNYIIYIHFGTLWIIRSLVFSAVKPQ